MAPPRGGGANPPVWSADGRSILQLVAKEGRANLASFDAATGKQTELTRGNQAIVSFRFLPDGSRIAYTVSTPTQIGDLFWLDKSSAEPKQLTHLNDDLFSRLNISEPEEIWYTSFDGKKIQAWLQKPADFDQNNKHP